MAGYQTRLATFQQRPYYDDYDVNKKFLQVLFRPGMPVQARELTQMQTILQDQIARLGGHFFDNGSKIIGGETSIKQRIEYIKLDPNTFPSGDNYNFIGGTVTKGTLIANITHYIPADVEKGDPATLYVEYISAEGDLSSFSNSGIYNITITNGGSGYDAAPTISFIGGGGTGANANAIITGGVVTDIVITNRGTGYTSAPIVSISAPTGLGPVTAIAEATLVTENVTVEFQNTETDLQESITYDIGTDPNTIGYGALVFINDGIYFINGRFVVVDSQILIVSKYADITANGNELPVGFLVKESIVTPEEDSSLYDNAIGSTNETAPGATRYKIEVTLAIKPDDENVKDFIQIMVLKEGVASSPPNQTDYTPLFLEMFARRTYDEAGDFIVNDFLLDLKEHLNNGTNGGEYPPGDGGLEHLVSLTLDPGKAYVRGYEVETNTPTKKTTDKSRDIDKATDIFISNPYNNYLYVNLAPGSLVSGSPTTLTELVQLDNSTITQLKKSNGDIIFTTILMGIEPFGGDYYKIFFTQLTPTTANSKVNDIAYIDQSGKLAAVTSPPGIPTISVSQSSLLYNIPLSYVKNITSTVFRAFKYQIGTISGSDTITLPPDSTLQYVGDINAYTVIITGVGYVRPILVSVSPTGAVALQLPSTYTANYSIWANVARKIYAPKVKTSASGITGPTSFTNNNLIKDFKLNHVDIKELIYVKIDGVDYTVNYELDNGQRDNMYAYGRIKLKPGNFLPSSGNIEVSYTYYQHSAGDFFTVDSYTALAYEDIPSYNGTFLGNVIDLRYSEATGDVMPLVAPNKDLIIDYSYYLARRDIIVVDNKRNFSVLRGVPSLTPAPPKGLNDAITLYELSIPAYTFKSSDIMVNKFNYKRFTMKDIANLEKRIESLEYYTQLSLLEADIQGKEFLDKFKNGFIVDNFESLTTGDVENPLHTIALDFNAGEMRAEAVTKAVNVVATTLSNCVNTNGIITLPYTEVPYQEQKLASTVVRIQPFIKFNWNGKIKLTPSFDNWISYTQAPDLTLDGGFFPATTNQSQVMNKVWDVAARIFVGTETSNNQSGKVNINAGGASSAAGVGVTSRSGSGFRVTERVSVSTQTNFVGTRVVDIGAVPYIRSRWVKFSITGLKPNTKVTPYFDGVNVSTYCFKTQPQVYYGQYWNWVLYNGSWVSQQTSGSNDVFISNGAGVIEGWFNIPNNSRMRFKTGVRKFAVYDTLENPTTSAEGDYVANGTNITLQNVFVTTTFVRRDQFWYDPVAQSFEVSNDEGIFATSADLFFGPNATGSGETVTVQIRNMVNGYPGEHVATTVDRVVNVGSSDAQLYERFTFDHPVYLEPKKEYALVVITDSTDLTVWVSELGQKSVRPGDTTSFSGEYINKQPYLGSLFKSQNNSTWTAEQTQDLKFRLNRAKFTVTGSAIATFANELEPTDAESEANIFKQVLDNNPFSVAFGARLTLTNGGSGYTSAPTITASATIGGPSIGTVTATLGSNVGVDDDKVVSIAFSGLNGFTAPAVVTINNAGTGGTGLTILSEYFPGNKVYVRHPNHGFKAGDLVTLSYPPLDVLSPTLVLGDFNTNDLHGTHTITSATTDTYNITISTGSNNDTVDFGGGDGIVASQIVPYSYVRIMTDAIVLNGTHLEWKIQSRDYATRFIDSYETGVAEGGVVDLGALKVVSGNDRQSLQLKSYFGTSTDYLSPVINEERVTVYTTVNRINSSKDSRVDDLGNEDYKVNNSISRYATKNITLANSASELQVYIDINLPTGTGVNLYCMVANEPVSVSNVIYDWHPMTLVQGGSYTDVDVFKEAKWVYDSPIDFSNFVIKAVLSSWIEEGDTKFRTITPRCKRFRGIALKT